MLSRTFMADLKTGILKEILDVIRKDQTLDFQIRNNQVHIYYAGGKILDLKPKSSKGYYASFDENYCVLKKHTPDDLKQKLQRQGIPELPNHIMTKGDGQKWAQSLAPLKTIMDAWFVEHPKIERKHQQLLIDQNNKLAASDKTDFFIIDIEYTRHPARFDMVAMSWPTDSAEDKPRLAFIEFKVGDNALKSSSTKTGVGTARTIPGIVKHLGDFTQFITPDTYASVKREMITVLKQKLELDVFSDNEKRRRIGTPDTFSDQAPQFIFLFANHNPKSTILQDELQNISDAKTFELKIALLKYKRYSLTHKTMFNLSDAKDELSRRHRSAATNKA
ncbi:MAG: hypothetical protein OSB41_04620 [Kiritimatiellae bacterium]|nr:hypothetical protein [Kiritimatiellia bacterium]